MRLKSLHIEGLFEQFDYTISFDNQEGLLVITGPNGFGKTTILAIIYNFFHVNFEELLKFYFERIQFVFTNDAILTVSKGRNTREFKLSNDGSLKHNDILKVNFADKEYSINPFSNTAIRQLGSSFQKESIVERKLQGLDVAISQKLKDIFFSFQPHLISTKRLYTEVDLDNDGETDYLVMTESIKNNATKLKNIISENLEEYFKTSVQLDNSFPKRLISAKESLDKELFNQKSKHLQEKQQKLKQYNLVDQVFDDLGYDAENAKVLSVYLQDVEEKLGVLNPLISRLDLFTTILNERRFLFKKVHISKDKGFHFTTDKGKELKITQLSSGEQHEVILIFELLFNTEEDTLVLIDEPEISLHVTWQKEFIKDILEIIKLQKIQVIAATHSPQIINGRWDLTYNLADAYNAAAHE